MDKDEIFTIRSRVNEYIKLHGHKYYMPSLLYLAWHSF